MKLTDKAKEQFEKWYLELIRKERKDYSKYPPNSIWQKFYRSLPSQQWGIYQDFADSLGYAVGSLFIRQNSVLDGYKDYHSPFIKRHSDTDEFAKDLFTYQLLKTRQEARKAAIEKLNQVINEG